MAHLGNTWNPADFMKFGGFHDRFHDGFHEIWRISWNSADFMPRTLVLMKKIQHSVVDVVLSCISVLVLQKNTAKSTIHEIRWISWWNLVNFMKSGGFHMQIASFAYEIRQISWWNPMDFIHEIRRISWLILKNANFFYNAYNFFFYVNQISNSLAMGSPRLSLWPGTISSS